MLTGGRYLFGSPAPVKELLVGVALLGHNSQVLYDRHEMLERRVTQNAFLFIGLIHQFQQQVINIFCIRTVLLRDREQEDEFY